MGKVLLKATGARTRRRGPRDGVVQSVAKKGFQARAKEAVGTPPSPYQPMRIQMSRLVRSISNLLCIRCANFNGPMFP